MGAEAPAPPAPEAELVETRLGRLRIDGDRIPGEPWHDPLWEPRVGRPFSSTHVALAESSLEPAGPAWWDGLRG